MGDQDCLFCRVVAGTIPAKVVYQDARVVAFEDIHPQAPVHVLVIPRTHLATLDDATDAEVELLGHLVRTASRVARTRELASGWRLVANTRAGAGQSVFHVHFHVLGGRPLSWPPG